MRQLLTVLTDSFTIGSRNFTLVYVFLFALLLFQSLLSSGGMPAWEWRWGLYALVLLLLFSAIMAGWFNMVGQACAQFLGKPRLEALTENQVKSAFLLFRHFLPGIGRFFAPVSVAYFVQTALGLLLAYPISRLWMKNAALLMKVATMDVANRMAFIQKLPLAQQTNLGEVSFWILTGFLAYSLFSMLIMLWPVYVVFYNQGGLKACLLSILQFFRDPLRLIAISLLVAGLRIPLFLLSGMAAANSLFLGATIQMLGLLVEVLVAIIIFVYAYQRIGKPVPPENADTSETTLDKPSSP